MNQSHGHKRILNVGIIGCGKMSRNHSKAIELSDQAKIVALADPGLTPDDLPVWFERDIAFFKDAEEMLRTAKPDVVHIVTPPNTHFALAKLALELGINVYIEKPFLRTGAETNNILAIADQGGLKVCAGHQLLFTRAADLLRSSLDSIGDIVHIESYFSFNTVRRGISPTDQLIDILPHPVYLLEEFLDLSDHARRSKIELRAIETTHEGEVRALLRTEKVTGSLIVSLAGRPVDSFIKVIGTNGSLHADFVRGFVVQSQGPGASVFSVLLIPYVRATQIFLRTTGSIFRLFSDRKKGYPGLPLLVSKFYKSIIEQTDAPISTESLQNTVAICEAIEKKARAAEKLFAENSMAALQSAANSLDPLVAGRGRILLTGGTGLFGRPTAALVRKAGWPVTVLSRNIPSTHQRQPGIDYVSCDLGEEISEELLEGVETIIHAAAETNGGQSAQERNSIKATSNLLQAAEKAGVKNFLHISSIAVLKPSSASSRNGLDEYSPVDLDNLARGPYVWGKAKSEDIATVFGKSSKMNVKIVRLGPLVDYEDYKPPGRLGREIHNLYVAMGSSKDKLSVCSTQTAAKVMTAYIDDFKNMPPILNLVEPTPPTRKELLQKWQDIRSPLYVIRLPSILLSILSPLLIMAQKILIKGKKPVDIKSAFSSETYDTSRAKEILEKADSQSHNRN